MKLPKGKKEGENKMKLKDYRAMSTVLLKEERENHSWYWELLLSQDNKGWKAEWNKKINSCKTAINKINVVLKERGEIK